MKRLTVRQIDEKAEQIVDGWIDDEMNLFDCLKVALTIKEKSRCLCAVAQLFNSENPKTEEKS